MPGIRLTPEEVERGYNNRAAVPEHPYWLDQFLVRSASALEALRPVDVRYGPNPKETLDLYVPPTPVRGTLMFIHGGYWRAFDKSDHAFVAPAFVAAGFAVAIINYDLCPQVTIAAIVDECRRAVEWMSREGASHGAPAPLVIAGHSAGGHLVAMMYATDWAARGLAAAPFVGGVTLSGVHDLSPLVLFTHNADLRLDDAEAARVSPVNHAPSVDAPLVVAVGAPVECVAEHAPGGDARVPCDSRPASLQRRPRLHGRGKRTRESDHCAFRHTGRHRFGRSSNRSARITFPKRRCGKMHDVSS